MLVRWQYLGAGETDAADEIGASEFDGELI